MNKNLRIRVVENCFGNMWLPKVYLGKKSIFIPASRWNYGWYERKGNAIRAAERISKQIGIKYDPKMIKLHGC